MQQIVECVPNFSNGRNPEIYHGIADAIKSVSGAHVLNISADPDHNRTVVTFVGDISSVEEAAFQGIKYAAKHINLDEHEGEHPRIGATDVCPFIPVQGVTMADCVALAQRLGKRVGEELGIAVYLYGQAATRPDREKLSTIRKGQYELWKAEVATNPSRLPDFGPAEPKTWGATVIGARPFLIAYNIYLNSDKAELADLIARQVRFTGGGLRYLQAKGFLVEGQAQVSMNLTNFEKTPLHTVQELVRREAGRYGLSITKAELIGMTPQKAFMDAAKWYLQVSDMEDEQVLEYRLHEETGKETTLAGFLAESAADTPTPGGGSAAALAGALAAALTQMVAGLTVNRKKYAAVDVESQAILGKAKELRTQLTRLIAEDAAAFEGVMAAWRNKELDESAKAAAVEEAMKKAGEIPLQVARLSQKAASLGQKIGQVGNPNAVTDAAAGAIMAHAAVQAAALNVKINASSLKNKQLAQTWIDEVSALEAETAAMVEVAKKIAADRGGFPA